MDWEKVKKHVEKYKVEFNILNSLIGSRKFDEELKYLLENYPEILPVVPLLLAIREPEAILPRKLHEMLYCDTQRKEIQY